MGGLIATMSRIALLLHGCLFAGMAGMAWEGPVAIYGAEATTAASSSFSLAFLGPPVAAAGRRRGTTRSARWNPAAGAKNEPVGASSSAPGVAATAIRAPPGRAAAARGPPAASDKKDRLLDLLRRVPPNVPTPPDQTREILRAIRDLEPTCPTPDDGVVSERLAGTWELLWTAQDFLDGARSRGGLSGLVNWINPIENQAYSNNPLGRSDPVLPRQVQDRLEQAGVLVAEGGDDDDKEDSTGASRIVSTQTIDIQKGRVRNVVSLRLALPPPPPLPFFSSPEGKSSPPPSRAVRASVAVDVDFRPDPSDPRRVNVKFRSCAVRVPTWFPSKELKFPLGIAGPTGWLRTVYLDEDLRVTRGHKGSVFVLRRPGSGAATGQ